MRVTYIKEVKENNDILGKRILKYPDFIQKIYIYTKKKFGICNIKKISKNEKLKVLPYTIDELIQKQKWYKKQVMREENIILSKDILLNKTLEIEDCCNIWDGKRLFQYLIVQTLEYISKKTEIDLEKMNVAILILDITNEKIKLIEQLAKRARCISVVTKNISKIRKIEEKLYKEKGIAIKVSNNKKKSLKRETIIINMDLKQKELEEYEINRKAIIINIKETIHTISKGFSRN